MLWSCTTSLDLSYYTLVSNDTAFCFTSLWHHVTWLSLNSRHEWHVSVHAMTEISRVNIAVFSIWTVYELLVMEIFATSKFALSSHVFHAGDGRDGWIEACQRLHPANRSQLVLQESNASGLRSSLTKSCLKAVLSVYPLLMRLNLRTAQIMEEVEPKFRP